MAANDYPVDVRADRPPQSSRLWAVLTILLIKLLAVIPHLFVLIFLGIAQWVVAFVAQFIVAVRGEYPPGLYRFVVGVLRWSTRVSAFVLSLSDRYPPFSLEPDGEYPVDVAAERPAQQSRLYALFTVIVQVLLFAGLIALAVALARHDATYGGSSSTDYQNQTWTTSWGTGFVLRQLAALPHYVVLFVLGFVALVLWLVVQWVILVTASYPEGMYDITAGVVRWQVRVQAYALGLVDRYPPFTFEPSVAASPAAAGPGAYGQAAGPYPPPPPPPALAQPPVPPAAPEPATVPAATPAPALAPAPAPEPAPPAGWYTDPQGRHQYRYWDGAAWTATVGDDGVTSTEA